MCRFVARPVNPCQAAPGTAKGRMLKHADGAVSIVATTIQLLTIEEQSAEALAASLDVNPAPDWPPEFNGTEYRDWQRRLLSSHPTEPGWGGWYVIGNGELVGTAGYKGPPDADGTVEIGYSIIAPRRRRGFAAAAVNLLVGHALADPRVQRVLAETLPDGEASQRVLLATGFQPAGSRVDPDDGVVLRFVRTR